MLDELFGASAQTLLAEMQPAVAVVISTAGIYNSRYIFANHAYFSLVGLSWAAICDQNLVGAGAAISNSERDRRLFLLDTAGSYDGEKAFIRHSSGRVIEAVIDAWRFTHAGAALDLEILRPALPAAPEMVRIYPASGAPKARLRPNILQGLSQMKPGDRRNLLLRMLMAVSEGAILLGTMMEPHMPAARYGLNLRARLQGHIDETRSNNGRVSLDFEGCDTEQIEAALLEIAGEIWSLHRFSRDERTLMMLGSLVDPYTLPPLDIGRGA